MIPNYYEIHSEKIISLLVGNLLGDAWGEKRSNSTRFHIHMGSPNTSVEYLRWLHAQYASKGYCSTTVPVLRPLGPSKQTGKIYRSQKIRTYSYSSFNWLYDAFYTMSESGKMIRTIPLCIGDLFTPRAFATLIMDDGSYSSAGVLIFLNNFIEKDVDILRAAIVKRYGLHPTKQRQGKQFRIYFIKKEMDKLADIVRPYIIDCMKYKLGPHA